MPAKKSTHSKKATKRMSPKSRRPRLTCEERRNNLYSKRMAAAEERIIRATHNAYEKCEERKLANPKKVKTAAKKASNKAAKEISSDLKVHLSATQKKKVATVVKKVATEAVAKKRGRKPMTASAKAAAAKKRAATIKKNKTSASQTSVSHKKKRGRPPMTLSAKQRAAAIRALSK